MAGVPNVRIVSGGQTGVDRAALDVALALRLPCGGWCPRGRRAEDGAIPARYPLRETVSSGYPERTRRNVEDTDGTLILARGTPRGGTALTLRLARAAGRPVLVVDLSADPDAGAARRWLDAQRIRSLNVAGPRESDNAGVGAQASRYLLLVLRPTA